jgi:hypothetical protein
MPNTIIITVEDPDDILDAGMYGVAAEVQLQTSATETGIYADVTGTGSDPTTVVLSGVRSYEAHDPNGTVSSWYRTRYTTADGTTRVSDWSDPFQVAPEGSGLICSLWDVKQKMGETTDAQDESILEDIREVTAVILNLTRRDFLRSPSSGTETWYEDIGEYGLHASPRCLIYPRGIAALTTLEVAYSTQPATGGTFVTVPATEWELRPTETQRDYGWPATEIVILPTSGYRFASGMNTVRLTGARGWSTVPMDVQGIAVRSTVAVQTNKGSGGGAGPNGALVLENMDPGDYQHLIDTYRIPVLG